MQNSTKPPAAKRLLLVNEVEAAIDRILNGSLRDLVEDTGAMGFCHDASIELGHRLRRGRIRVMNLKDFTTRIQTKYIRRRDWYKVEESLDPALYHMMLSYGKTDEWHAVLDCGFYLIDLTAKQFSGELPFPYIIWRSDYDGSNSTALSSH